MVHTTFSSLLLASAALAATTTTHATTAAVIHPHVHRALQQNNGNTNVVIVFKQTTQDVLQSFEEESFNSQPDKINSMLNHLEANNADIQKDVFGILNDATLNDASDAPVQAVRNLTITSNLYVDGASKDFIERVANLTNVQEVRPPQVIELVEPPADQISKVDARLLASYDDNGVQWGVQKIRAPEVWQSGARGQNVIIGSIDSGVRATHEALRNNFIGAYGWFDPEAGADQPYDRHGHGTHTMGTMVGQNGIGIAPDAKWMACKGCRDKSCPEYDLMKCFEFMTCPTDPRGNNRDCSKVPHVINNSWGGGHGSTVYDDAIAAWHKAGIIPIFANGNEGPSCGTAGSPGDSAEVIAVGATTEDDGIASFSSKGPSRRGGVKPELSAPGNRIYSTLNSDDSQYGVMSGTSMAAPHVTGAVALMLSAHPGLTYEQVKKSLLAAVDTSVLHGDNQMCDGRADDAFPNNAFGYGRLNVFNAIKGSSDVPPVAPTASPSSQPTVQPTSPPTRTPEPTELPTPSSSPEFPFPTSSSEPPLAPVDPQLQPDICSRYRDESWCNWDFNCHWDPWTRVCASNVQEEQPTSTPADTGDFCSQYKDHASCHWTQFCQWHRATHSCVTATSFSW